jgi:hypothetical protein
MKGTPVESSMKQAWWFLTFTVIAILVVSFMAAICLVVPFPFLFSASGGAPPGSPGPGFLAVLMSGMTAVSFVIAVPFMLLYVLLWGLATHGILRIGGRGHETIRRTFQALCYSSGAYVICLAPCVGGTAGPIWWLVSAVLMVKAGHKVSGARATLAVVTLPVILTVLAVAAYATLIVFAIAGAQATATAAGGFTPPVQKTQVVLDAVLDHAADWQGSWPVHALALAEKGYLTEWDYLGTGTPTGLDDVPVDGAIGLLEFVALSSEDRAGTVEELTGRLPAGMVAHRFGDFVFTYHGIDGATAPGGLWLVVMTPDPDAGDGSPPAGPVVVGMADGTTQAIARYRLPEALARQNELRVKEGLPPLSDPSSVTHDAPAIGVR